MKNYIFLLIPFGFVSCFKAMPETNDNGLSKDYKCRKQILLTQNCDFFTKLETADFDSVKAEYLQFVFAYMPLCDFADNEFEFFERQVDFAILAKTTFPWSSKTPEDIFKHYVLPPRVNNENLDTARMVIFRELKERLLPMNLSMEEAALEVNHWCHEKVVYRGTDERTISPLAAMKSGFGRCGEESTFLVTALRAVGIPARQVYTPRWAHTDDNHAWVEVWIDGEWKFLGACEPAPVLNSGWFAVPATRTMLIHTKQFGQVDSENSDFLSSTSNYTWLNATKTYAPLKKLTVVVVKENNIPVWLADVQFQLYNYAELYPLHTTKTDFAGVAEFETGYGSLEVFVSYKGKFASQTIDPEQAGIVKIYLKEENTYPATESFYMPPSAGVVAPDDSAAVQRNAERLKEEDNIRAEFESTFYDDFKAREFVRTFGYPDEVKPFLINSRGNWFEIESFLIEYSYKDMRNDAIAILSVISEKDLRDTRSEILTEHLDFSLKYKNPEIPDSIFKLFVLCPRVEFEMLKQYRELIISDLDSAMIDDFINEPAKISDYILSEIKTESGAFNKKISGDAINTYRVPLTPSGVQKLKFSDFRSLMIYTVAFYRTLGIPARIDFASNTVQYYHQGTWTDVILSKDKKQEILKRSKLYMQAVDESRELKYRIHFSLARLNNGNFETVDLGWEVPLSSFAEGVDLPCGEYMLLTSVRNQDGSVNVKRKYFELNENTSLTIKVELPDKSENNSTAKTFNHSQITDKYGSSVNSSGLVTGGSYTAFCWLEPGKEPSKHIVRDINPMLAELKKNKISVIYLVSTSEFEPIQYGYPADLKFYYDKDFALLNINSTCKVSGGKREFPQIILVDSNAKTVFSSEGYTIAVGEMLVNAVSKD